MNKFLVKKNSPSSSSATTEMGPVKVNIGGLSVQFPYVPYECQRSFMEHMAEALETGKNAALESPTGTGKTLSLLCSAIAWVQQQKQKIRPQAGVQPNGLVQPKGATEASGNGTAQATDLPPPEFYARIFYASRTHSQLRQVVRELNKTAYKSVIKVATLAGRDQLCLNDKVRNEQNSEVRGQICRLMTKEKKCGFYNQLDMDTEFLDKMYETENTNGNAMDIEELVSEAKKHCHCPFYGARHFYKKADLILLPYNYLLDPRIRDMYEIRLKGSILIFDEAHNLEGVAEESMSVDFSTRTLSVAIRETKTVLELVMEEVEEQRTEMDVRGESFALLDKLAGGRRKGRAEEENGIKVPNVQETAKMLVMLQSLEEQIDSLETVAGAGSEYAKLTGRVYPGHALVSLLQRAGIQRQHRDPLFHLIDRICSYLAKQAEKNNGIWAARGTALTAFSVMLSVVFLDTTEDESQNFQLYVEKKEHQLKGPEGWTQTQRSQIVVTDPEDINDPKQLTEITLHFWCFSAGVAMRYLQSTGVRSMVLASGTLAPLDKYKESMGVEFGPMLESKHCARQEQLVVGGLAKGPNNAELLGTFQKRNDSLYRLAVGELVLQLAKLTPQGMLTFFPSYSQMAAFIDSWKTTRSALSGGTPLWDHMENQKRLFIEPREKGQIGALFRNFDNAVREQSGGGLLFAVCRGKLSEGIDFADSHCRCVLIVGIPFPPLYDARVILKKAHLAGMRRKGAKILNPEEWYKIEGTRAVNQALGRIIRHKDDFGAVVLADSRFLTMSKSMFPSWMRPSMQAHKGTGTLLPVIQRFFAERGILVEQSRQKMEEQHKEEQKQRQMAFRKRSGNTFTARFLQDDDDWANQQQLKRQRNQGNRKDFEEIVHLYSRRPNDDRNSDGVKGARSPLQEKNAEVEPDIVVLEVVDKIKRAQQQGNRRNFGHRKMVNLSTDYFDDERE